MGVYALTSISGSPGVTTTAVAWAMTSGRPTLLVEADLTGGSPILAGVFRSELPHTTSLLALSMRTPGTTMREQLWTQAVGLPGATDAWVVPAVAAAGQAGALTLTWEPLGAALQELSTDAGFDVLIDAGRYRPGGPGLTLLQSADTVLVATWSHLVGLHTAVTGIDHLRQDLGDITADKVAAITLATATQSFSHAATTKVMAPSPTLTQLPHLPAAAATYSLGTTPPRGRTTRRYRSAITTLASAAARQADTHRTTTLGGTT